MSKEQTFGNTGSGDSDERRLKMAVEEATAKVHRSLAAWHELGARGRVKSSFDSLRKQIGPLRKRAPGYFERIRDFFSENDDREAGLLAETKSQLLAARDEIAGFETVIRTLDNVRHAALDAYRSWMDSAKPDPAKVADDRSARAVAYGLEYLAAQQQLTGMIMMQLQEHSLLMAEITHVISMTEALVNNYKIAANLLRTDFGTAQDVLRKYASK